MLQELLGRQTPTPTTIALCTPTGDCSHHQLAALIAQERASLASAGISAGDVVALIGPLDPLTVARLAALALHQAIVAPLAPDSLVNFQRFADIAQFQWHVGDERGPSALTGLGRHPIYDRLRQAQHPGLVLFSSGSSGEPKAAVHDFSLLLEKFRQSRPAWRTLAFLQPDHIGGINTIWHTLANGGTLVVPAERTPSAVCQAIAAHRVELLPTSPTFLNFLLISGEHRRHNLSSLRRITYGTEPMPQATLERLATELPGVELQQTYGLTEVGILSSKSQSDQSLWVRVGGEGYETKIVDGRLWIRARSAMLGYLNAPYPIDAEGYFDTGDTVEVDGPWLKILGRASELINVGGQKVYPSEVEAALLELPQVAEASVFGQTHPLTGQIVAARVLLTRPEPLADFKLRMRQALGPRLAGYKIPARVELVQDPLWSARFKKQRPLPTEEVTG